MKRKQLPSVKPERLSKKLKPKLQKQSTKAAEATGRAEDEETKPSAKHTSSPEESQRVETEAETGKKKLKRKQKMKDAEQETEAADAEQQRRALQRKIQQLVMRLRNEGKTPAEIRSATRELKAKSPWSKEKPPKETKDKKEKQRLWEENAAKKRKEHLQKQHDLVIIPVVWRGRHDKLDVVKAAEDIKACLSQQGLDVWMDSRRHLTPGQKFAHWEHRGVLLRIEIGPDDLKAGVCQVCLAHTPGDYKSVERKRVSLPPSGTRSLLLRLKEWGLEQLEIERRAGDSEEEEEDEEAPNKKAVKDKTQHGKAPTPSAAEDVQGNWSPRVEEKAKGSKGGKRRKKV